MFQIHIQCILCFIQCNLSFCKIKKSNYNNKFSLNAVVKRYFLLSSYFKSLYRLCLLSYTIQYMVLEIETSLIIISYLGVINLVIASKNDINGLDIHYTKWISPVNLPYHYISYYQTRHKWKAVACRCRII